MAHWQLNLWTYGPWSDFRCFCWRGYQQRHSPRMGPWHDGGAQASYYLGCPMATSGMQFDGTSAECPSRCWYHDTTSTLCLLNSLPVKPINHQIDGWYYEASCQGKVSMLLPHWSSLTHRKELRLQMCFKFVFFRDRQPPPPTHFAIPNIALDDVKKNFADNGLHYYFRYTTSIIWLVQETKGTLTKSAHNARYNGRESRDYYDETSVEFRSPMLMCIMILRTLTWLVQW